MSVALQSGEIDERAMQSANVFAAVRILRFCVSINMNVITGSTGLVGSNLVRSLLAQNRPARAIIHRAQRALDGLNIETVRADINDPSSLDRAFAGAEIVYHLASAISIRSDTWDELQRINVIGTRNVIDACLRNNVRRLIYFSSIHARQQHPLDQLLDEDRPLVSGDHVPPYERSKAAAEIEIRRGIDRGLDAVIILPTAILGPYDFQPSYIGEAIQLLASGRIPALVHGGYDFVDVRDVAEGTIRAAETAPTGSRYILSGHWHSVSEIAAMIGSITGKHMRPIILPIELAQAVQPIIGGLALLNGSQPLYTKAMLNALRSNRCVSHARASRDLGYSPRPLIDTIQDTLAWFEQNN
jgi:dihydroflavonol-4-reductase